MLLYDCQPLVELEIEVVLKFSLNIFFECMQWACVLREAGAKVVERLCVANEVMCPHASIDDVSSLLFL